MNIVSEFKSLVENVSVFLMAEFAKEWSVRTGQLCLVYVDLNLSTGSILLTFFNI